MDPDINYDFFSRENSYLCNYYSMPEYHEIRKDRSISIISQNIVSFNRRIDSLLACFQTNFLPSIFCITVSAIATETGEPMGVPVTCL